MGAPTAQNSIARGVSPGDPGNTEEPPLGGIHSSPPRKGNIPPIQGWILFFVKPQATEAGGLGYGMAPLWGFLPQPDIDG